MGGLGVSLIFRLHPVLLRLKIPTHIEGHDDVARCGRGIQSLSIDARLYLFRLLILVFISLLLNLCSFDFECGGDLFMSSVTSSREYKESDSESEYCSPCFGVCSDIRNGITFVDFIRFWTVKPAQKLCLVY